MRLSRASLSTFASYSALSTAVFAPEYLLFLFLIHRTSLGYLAVTIVTYVFGVTLQYALVRHFVFAHTARALGSGYALFVAASCMGAGMVSILMVLFVEFFGMSYAIARLLAAAGAGFAVYLFNLHTTFKA